MKTMKKMTVTWIALVLSLVLLAGCAGAAAPDAPAVSTEAHKSGSLIVSVNPKLELRFDDKGIVTSVSGLNADGRMLRNGMKETTGLETRQAVMEVIRQMIEKGYLKTDDDTKHVELELKEGSYLPNDDFVKNIVNDLQAFLKDNKIQTKLVLDDASDYGLPKTTDKQTTAPKAGSIKIKTDGTQKTDDSNYGTTKKPASQPANYDDTNYDDSDYGTAPVYDDDSPYDTNDDDSPYDTNYDDTNYDDDSNYDDSNYDDDSDYDDSDYDD